MFANEFTLRFSSNLFFFSSSSSTSLCFLSSAVVLYDLYPLDLNALYNLSYLNIPCKYLISVHSLELSLHTYICVCAMFSVTWIWKMLRLLQTTNIARQNAFRVVQILNDICRNFQDFSFINIILLILNKYILEYWICSCIHIFMP